MEYQNEIKTSKILIQKCLNFSKTLFQNNLYIPFIIGINGLLFVSWYKGLNLISIISFILLFYLFISIIVSKTISNKIVE